MDQVEQHPIPRQITTFEFKLIGFMTLTQFIYLIVFLPAAYLILRAFPVPILNIILAALIGGAGVALAFLPVNGRPLDVWIRNLYRRLMSPTQYFYHKQGPPLAYLQNLYFDSDPHKVAAHIDSQEKLSQYLMQPSPVSNNFTPIPASASWLEQKKQTIAQILQKPHDELKREAQATRSEASEPGTSVSQQESQTQEQEPPVSQAQQKEVETAVAAATPQVQEDEIREVISTVSAGASSTSSLASPKNPFFSGVVKNIKGIPLAGVLVYVKDEVGTPLRLLKSNPYGVFATYNPLPVGTYTFETKDPKGLFYFDTIKVAIKESNEEPIEIHSKEII